MGLLAPSPSHADINWRKAILAENETLARFVQIGLEDRARLAEAVTQHTKRRLPTAIDSGIPRPTTAATSNPSYDRSRYVMLTSASAVSLRMGGRPRAHPVTPMSTELGSFGAAASFGSLQLGKQSWQPTSQAALQALPAKNYVEARWPSIKVDCYCTAPCRPTQRMAASKLQLDNLRWKAGTWRLAKERAEGRSPRPTIF